MKTLSIIIPTYNEKNRIKNLLSAIRRFNTINFEIEIILVDNGSTDNTILEAKNLCNKIEICPSYTIAKLRNHGVKISKGDYIGFIDADCNPDENWALISIEYLDMKPHIGIVGSFYNMESHPTWVEKAWCEKNLGRCGEVSFLPAGNCSVRKKEFLEVGGFSEHLITGEDYDLSVKYRKKGFIVWNEPTIKSVHYGNSKTLTQILNREIWYGQGMLETFKRGEISKPFVMANLFFCGIIFMVIEIIFWVCRMPNIYERGMLISAALITTPILLSAILATSQSKKPFNFILYFPIYLAYYIGRTLSLFLIYFHVTKKHK